ncbi:hypothetical protein PC128_g22959 [Phytophthora cactorum]|nr:hypothetical protein PC128_g22959 [Phytophthora cactorum]
MSPTQPQQLKVSSHLQWRCSTRMGMSTLELVGSQHPTRMRQCAARQKKLLIRPFGSK